MVSKTDVIMAYRLLLGREPENDDVVTGKAAHFDSLEHLRSDFIESAEFRQMLQVPTMRPGDPGVKPLSWPPADVEVSVSPEILRRMVLRIEGEFLDLGATEPHWSVLTSERYRAKNIRDNETEFYASGGEAISQFQVAAARCGLDLSSYKSCFELGCGVGRITLWLARLFPAVTGADISVNHIDLARAAAERAGTTNISFLNINKIEQYETLPPFDVFLSLIVLQHNPPPLMAFILEAILTKLSPGGAAYFQIPTHLTNYSFRAADYVESPPMVGNAEVHCIPQAVLFEIIRRAGCEVLEIREDSSLGSNAISNRLLLRKSPR